MNLGKVVPLIFAGPLLICLLVREFRWRNRMQKWKQSKGRMLRIDYSPDRDEGFPVIGYEFGGEQREQICDFNLSTPSIGKDVPIIINPITGKIFITTFKDRWNLSAILFSCILLLFTLAFLSN